MTDRRKEIERITACLEAEKEQIEKRLQELYDEDTALWKASNTPNPEDDAE